MKLSHLFAASALSLAVAAPAFADSIDFAQFGAEFTNVANGATGVTNGGVNFTIFGPGANFTEYQEGSGWAGEFANGQLILFDGGPGAVTINFATAINSIQHLEAQANLVGAYTATLTAFAGLTNLGSVSYNSMNNLGPEGSIPYLDFFGAGITSITISTTNDGAGFALGGTGGRDNAPPGGVPEPASWALMISGFGLAGAALRRRRVIAA